MKLKLGHKPEGCTQTLKIQLNLAAGRGSVVDDRWSPVAGRWLLVAGSWSLVAGLCVAWPQTFRKHLNPNLDRFGKCTWALVAGRWSGNARGRWWLVAGAIPSTFLHGS